MAANATGALPKLPQLAIAPSHQLLTRLTASLTETHATTTTIAGFVADLTTHLETTMTTQCGMEMIVGTAAASLTRIGRMDSACKLMIVWDGIKY